MKSEKISAHSHHEVMTDQEGKDLLATIVRAVSDKKAESIVSLDMTGIAEAVADYFVLCNAQNALQVEAIFNNVEKTVWQDCGEQPYHVQKGTGWTLIDYVDIVVHIFKPEERAFYDLEGLWLDSLKTEYPS